MKTLIIVDFQKDFSRRSGALYVPGSGYAELSILEYIKENKREISDVVFTIDWHSPKHCSFIENGGKWPAHCIQYSEGAGISDDLIKACLDYNIPYKIFKKGNIEDIEEYGAFGEFTTKFGEIWTNNARLDSSLKFDSKELVVCGIAGDYCVKETLTNLLKCSVNFSLQIFLRGVSSIDSGKNLHDFLEENKKYIEII